MNISGIFKLFAHWSDCVDRNDKVFTLLYKIVMHKKVSHPDEIQNIYITNIYLRILNFIRVTVFLYFFMHMINGFI